MGIEDKIVECLQNKSKYLFCKRVETLNIKIEERVKLQCFHCEKYNQKWTCPPKIDRINFESVFKEYKNAMIIYCSIPFNNKQEYDRVRNDSTNLLHKTLLDLEKILYDNNYIFSMSFIGGSCKLCKDECSTTKCRFPHLSRIPLEATGVNVIDFIKSELNIEIKFPPEKFLYRFGLLVW